MCSSCLQCGGNTREGFKISLGWGGLRVRLLPGMSGSKGTEPTSGEVRPHSTARRGGEEAGVEVRRV